MNRRSFFYSASVACALFFIPSLVYSRSKKGGLVSVLGSLKPKELGSTLIHEHVLVDFIGADQVGPHRYNIDEAFQVILPYLQQLKEVGCQTLVECTPEYLGRDVKLLKRLSEATGLNIITNTGYYGAVGGKFLPPHVHTEDAQQLASRWISEWEKGIDGTGIYPGFIKTGVDKGPLGDINRKLLKAAALTHLQTGLTISAHTGDGNAAMEELQIIKENGVDPSAFRWVHTQNEKNKELHVKAAQEGAWVEFDGISPKSMAAHLDFVKSMKENGLLHKTLISQDAGWYRVGEENGGKFRSFVGIYEEFLPALKNEGFTDQEINQLLIDNPKESFFIKVRKL